MSIREKMEELRDKYGRTIDYLTPVLEDCIVQARYWKRRAKRVDQKIKGFKGRRAGIEQNLQELDGGTPFVEIDDTNLNTVADEPTETE